MKSKLRWLLLIIPLALLAWAWQAASWRPKLVGVHDRGTPKLSGGLFAPPEMRLLLSPDGEKLVSHSHWSTNDANSLMVWDAKARKLLWQKLEVGRIQTPLAWTPDGKTLATADVKNVFGGPSFAVSLVDVATGAERRAIKISTRSNLDSAAFLSNRELVVSTSQYVTVADIQSGQTVRRFGFDSVTFQEDPKRLSSAQSQVSADGTTVIALANDPSDTRIFIYDTRTGKERGHWIYPGIFRNPRLSPDGKLWAMGRDQTNLSNIYDAPNGQQLGVSFIGDADNSPWAWSADSRNIAAPYFDKISLFDARTKRELARVAISRDYRVLALSPDGDYFYTLDDTGKIWRWRAR